MPPDFLSEEVAKKGGWLLHLFIGSYMFAAVASVCDIYFVPSLEHISEDLDLQADVAGATFMAAASSAPEFCTSVITTLVAKSDAGLGAIVGSSIFNLLVIVGACAIFAGMPVQLTWYPLTRDTIFYTLSVILMAVFMYDNLIIWYEATLMVVTYLLYILVMFFNKRLERWSILKMKSCRRQTLVDIMEEEESANNRLAMMDARRHSRICTQDMLTRSGMREIERLTMANIGDPKEILTKASRVTISETLVRNISSLYNKVESVEFPVASPVNVETGTSTDPVPAVSAEVQIASPVVEEEDKDDKIGVSEYTNPLEFPKGFLSRCYYIFILPATVLHAFTIPDSRLLGTWQAKLYLVSFTLSVVYIGVYSYIMVWMITMAGNVWGIPDTITGLTVLAAGTSVPDLLSSVFVARDGYGDMAVSNAIGSNVFDILLCLGIPWLIDNLSISKNGTVIDSEGMVFAVLTLFITIAYLWGSMKCFNWTLTPVYGFVTISVYLVIMTICILIETNVLFSIHEPSPCKQ
ncbi:unnamed protein product [Lymnaea stagnalis]|uniref:Sodium/calcium exchanger membrane region domain-containing protein n=1 Tax=Lymnaea stagnalis TaxID=6523 RepID=A0AAV2H8X6_LYMST